MKNLPNQYKFLSLEPGPSMLVEALRHYGELELKGPGNSPSIMLWAEELVCAGILPKGLYTSDSIAWCGLFMALVAKRCDYKVSSSPLWALNWANFGEKAKTGKLGYVMTFKRYNNNRQLIGGHVGLYVGEDAAYYHILGGNTADSVSIARLAKDRIYSIRKPIYKIGEPSNVRRIALNANGPISLNEA